MISGSDTKTVVPQAFLLFFTEHYYSAIRDFNTSPRPLWKGQPSEKEIAASINGFMADSGTYEFDGSTLVVHHTVALIPNLAAGGSMTFGCQLKGDTLTLIPKFDKLVMPGMGTAPSGNTKAPAGNMEVRYKFRRLE